MTAFAGGACAHAFELDDVHEEAISHPGAVVVPAALAVAEAEGRSGLDFLDAVVVGYEAMGRAGIAVGPASHMLKGFHPTGQSGVFGAAAAAGHLLGLAEADMTYALGIAASFSSGTTEFSQSGGDTKRLHAARAAEGGVTAAYLAADGFVGPTAGLDGKYGWCRIFTDEPRIDLLTDQLGERWMIDEITVKPYAACSDIHPLIDAAIQLRDNGVDPAEIADVRAEVPTKAAEQNNLDGTTSVMAAKYSGPFNIAAAFLADPEDPEIYSEANIGEPHLLALQAKVTAMSASAEFDATYAWKMGGRLIVRTNDGVEHEATVIGQRGSMHQPLSRSEIARKFERLVAGRAEVGALQSAVAELRGADSVAELALQLAPALGRDRR